MYYRLYDRLGKYFRAESLRALKVQEGIYSLLISDVFGFYHSSHKVIEFLMTGEFPAINKAVFRNISNDIGSTPIYWNTAGEKTIKYFFL